MTNEKLNVEITATDKASAPLADVAKKVDALESKPHEVLIEADDQATAEVNALDHRLDKITGEDRVAILRANAKQAQAEIDVTTRKLAQAWKYDDQQIDVMIVARDNAKEKLDRVQSELNALDGDTARVEVVADTSALDDLQSKLEGIDGPIGDIGAKLSKLASPGGAVTALGTGLLLAGDYAADIAVEADNLARLTGDSVEEASRLNAVWKSSGADSKDLQDVMLQMGGVLSTNADLAKKLGINLKDGKTLGERFVEVIGAAETKIDDAGERAVILGQVFGEEGVRQVNAMVGAVGDIGAAIEDLPEGTTITEEDVKKAREFKAQVTEVKLEFMAMAAEIGGGVIPGVIELLGYAREIGGILGSGLGTKDWDPEADKAAEAAAERLGKLSEMYGEAAWAARDFKGATDDSVPPVKDATIAAREYEDAVASQAVVSEISTESTRLRSEAERDVADASAEAAEAAEELTDQIDELYSANLRLVGGDIAVREAQRQATEAMEAYTKAVDEGKLSTGEMSALQDQTAESLLGAARAASENEIATARAAGVTVTAADETAIMRQKLVDLAAFLEPGSPLRAQIEGYVGDLDAIPSDVDTAIAAQVDQASLDEAERLLEHLRRNRNANIIARLANPGALGGIDKAAATGASYTSNDDYLVGERGPEIVRMPNGARVTDAANTARQMASGGAPSSAGFSFDYGKLARTIASEMQSGIAATNAAQLARVRAGRRP